MPFMDLPAELRLHIYSYSFGYEETMFPRWTQGHPSRSVALLRTCRKIHEEAELILYRQTALVVHGRSLHPFPATIDRHFSNTRRTWLRDLIIIEPRVMPYRYARGVSSRRCPEWTFDILRHLPGVRSITITDIGPIPVHISTREECKKVIRAVEKFLRLHLSQTMKAFGNHSGISKYPETSVFTSVRVTFTRTGTDLDDDIQQTNLYSHECKWLRRGSKAGCSGELVVRAKVHPVCESVVISEEDHGLAREFLERHAEANDWFPVRSV